MATLRKKDPMRALGKIAYVLNFVLTAIAALEAIVRMSAFLRDRVRNKRSMGFTKDKE